MTIANNIRIKDSFCEAAHELIDWMVDDYGFTAQEAYLLLGQVLEARCTMLHGLSGGYPETYRETSSEECRHH